MFVKVEKFKWQSHFPKDIMVVRSWMQILNGFLVRIPKIMLQIARSILFKN